MPVIPIYQQESRARMVEGPRAEGMRVSDAVGVGLQQLGQGVESVAEGLITDQKVREQKLKQQEHEQAIAWAGPAMSNQQVGWEKTFSDRQRAAQPGTPEWANFTGKIAQDYDDSVKQLIDTAPTQAAKNLIATSATAYRTNLLDRAIKWQAAQFDAYKVDGMNKTIENATTLAAKNPALFNEQFAATRAMINELGIPADQKQQLHDKLRKDMANGVLAIRAQNDPQGTYNTLLRTFFPEGAPAPNPRMASESKAPAAAGFDSAVQWVLGKEGGYNASDGKAANPVNFGINQGANPDIDVKNLTREKAVELYKSRYWDAIGADNLPASVRMIAFDAAVNQGVGFAKQIIAEAKGDPAKMVELRRQRYEMLAQDSGHRRYLSGWLSRLSDVANVATNSIQAEAAARAVEIADSIPMDAKRARAGDTAIDMLTVPEALLWMQQAGTAARAQQSQGAAEFKQRLQDSTAAYLQGQADPKPLQYTDFAQHMGAMAPVAWAEYQRAQKLGANLQQVRTLPNSEQIAMLDASRPTVAAGAEGFADRQQKYEILAQAVEQTQKQRAADPVAYALAVRRPGINAITDQTLRDPAALATELRARMAAAPGIASDYGTGFSLLSKGEASGVAAALKAAPVAMQKQYLASLYTGTGDINVYKGLMQQLAPDAPVLAAAGIDQVRGQHTSATADRQATDLADLVLRGYAILHPNSKTDGQDHQGGKSLIKMPKHEEMLTDFNNRTAGVFKGRENSADLFYQKALAIYAARSAEEGDYSGEMNSKRWRSAVDLATGGVDMHNGANILLPYGWGYDKFREQLTARAPAFAAEAVNLQASELPRLPLENIGDGRYLVRRGTGYVVRHDGMPLELDFNGAPVAVPVPQYGDVPGAPGKIVGPRGLGLKR